MGRIDDPGGADAHVEEQEHEQQDPELHIREEVVQETEWPSRRSRHIVFDGRLRGVRLHCWN